MQDGVHNTRLQPFMQGGKYFSFYPYYLPKHYSNYYPRMYNRYYEPVSLVNIKQGPMVSEPEIFQKEHFIAIFIIIAFLLLVAFKTLRN